MLRRVAHLRPAVALAATRDRLGDEVATIRMGDVADFGNFMGAVIDAKAFAQHREAIEEARAGGRTIVAGGTTDDSEGYFVAPTVIETTDPGDRLLREELFGPIVTAFVYPDSKWQDTLELVDSTSPYALTGAVFARDRGALDEAAEALRYSAGNFYVNDKPTGAVVGQQPFGGGRASGTNDKAGSMWNLIRWVSPRTVKETFVPAAATTAIRSWRRTVPGARRTLIKPLRESHGTLIGPGYVRRHAHRSYSPPACSRCIVLVLPVARLSAVRLSGRTSRRGRPRCWPSWRRRRPCARPASADSRSSRRASRCSGRDTTSGRA